VPKVPRVLGDKSQIRKGAEFTWNLLFVFWNLFRRGGWNL